MKKLKIILVTSILITVISLIIYNIIGTSVEPSGTLVEPFVLIPIAWFFAFIAAISSILLLVSYLLDVLKNKK